MAHAKVKGIECDKCSTELAPDATFCHACGDPVDDKDRKIIADNVARAADVRRGHLERERDAEFQRSQLERTKINPHAPPLTFEDFMASHPEYNLDDPSSPTFQHEQAPPTADGSPSKATSSRKSTTTHHAAPTHHAKKSSAKKSAAKKKK